MHLFSLFLLLVTVQYLFDSQFGTMTLSESFDTRHCRLSGLQNWLDTISASVIVNRAWCMTFGLFKLIDC